MTEPTREEPEKHDVPLMAESKGFEFCDVEKENVEEATPVVATAVVVERDESTVHHFLSACLGTYFCSWLGIVGMLLWCNSNHGKGGAASGCAWYFLKIMILCGVAMVVINHNHTGSFEATGLDQMSCEAYGGFWVDEKDSYWYTPLFFMGRHHHHHHHEHHGHGHGHHHHDQGHEDHTEPNEHEAARSERPHKRRHHEERGEAEHNTRPEGSESYEGAVDWGRAHEGSHNGREGHHHGMGHGHHGMGHGHHGMGHGHHHGMGHGHHHGMGHGEREGTKARSTEEISSQYVKVKKEQRSLADATAPKPGHRGAEALGEARHETSAIAAAKPEEQPKAEQKVCACPRYFITEEGPDGSRFCKRSMTFWGFSFVLATIACCLLIFVRSYYLKKAVIVRPVQLEAQPAYPTEGVVVNVVQVQ